MTATREVSLPTTQTASRRAAAAAGRLATTFGLLVAAVLLWQLATVNTTSPFFPTPVEIAEHAQEKFLSGPASQLFLSDVVLDQAWPTVWRLALGFALGSIVGLLAGVVMGLSRAAKEFSNPVVEFLRSIPATASLPIFIILLGGDDAMRVAFVAWGISWYVLINTASGVSAIHPTMLQMGEAFRLGRRRRILRIVVPAAGPKIFAGLRIALTGALLLAVVSEFMLATNGIGFELIQSQRRFQILDMWSWMLLLALLGYALNTLLEVTENRLLAWHRLARS